VELRRDDDGAMLLSVADNGPGIPEAERALVFERFYRAAGQEATGSGLGLAIATQTAQRLGGAIRLDTGPGGAGCTFTATIPVATSTLA
jgi:signal transduction histidine kinase